MTEKILVIGSGFAGVSAANTINLLNSASRTRSKMVEIVTPAFQSGRVILDRGAEFLHGGNENPLIKMARSYGFKTTADQENVIIEGMGNGADLIEEILTKIERAAEDSKAENLQQLIDEVLENETEKDLAATIIGDADYGTLLKDISLEEFNSCNAGLGGYLVEGGICRVLEKFKEPVAHLIRKGMSVYEIRTAGDKVIIGIEDYNVLVRDKVIVTVPLACLKAKDIKFKLDVPQNIRDAIDSSIPSTLNKITYYIEPAFFEGRDIKSDTYLYIKSPTGIYINAIARPGGENKIVLFTGGRVTNELSGKSDNDIIEFGSNILSSFFGDDFKAALINTSFHNWNNDKFARAAYSVSTPEHRKVLAEPLVNGRVILAGEYTITEGLTKGWHYHTAGAYLSGIRAGVEAYYGNSLKPEEKISLCHLISDALSSPEPKIDDIRKFIKKHVAGAELAA